MMNYRCAVKIGAIFGGISLLFAIVGLLFPIGIVGLILIIPLLIALIIARDINFTYVILVLILSFTIPFLYSLSVTQHYSKTKSVGIVIFASILYVSLNVVFAFLFFVSGRWSIP